jgi:hypothetical protein
MTKLLTTTLHFPITPINPQFATSLRTNLFRVLFSRSSDKEIFWFDHTTEHPTQYDIVCYQFTSLEDANEYAEEIALAISDEVIAWIAENGDDVLAQYYF